MPLLTKGFNKGGDQSMVLLKYVCIITDLIWSSLIQFNLIWAKREKEVEGKGTVNQLFVICETF